ncbi:MAG TPA: hypothetical protein VFG62_09215 [Rhodopila sp.]|nr:hypothetical protein [Rhodopila sp.]
MLKRIAAAVVITIILTVGGMPGASAQQPMSSGQQASGQSGWTFNFAPYLWFANINTDLNLNLPPDLGGTVSASSSVGFGDVISHLNLAFMGAADARYGRFSVLTDLIYLNVGGTPSQFKTVNFPNHPAIPVQAGVNSSQGFNLQATIWTLAGGYTLVQGGWGNFDLIAGFRLLQTNTRINYSLDISIEGPRGNGATFGGVGSVSGIDHIWNGIGGFRGRVRIGDNGLFIPYYFDIGAGGSNLTWQISSGIGYHTRLADLTLTYRYISFSQDGAVQRLAIKGPMLMATFVF